MKDRHLLRSFLRAALVWLFVCQAAQAVELPEKYKKWLEEEVVYIISPREKAAFEKLESVQEWEAFIEAFWRRRDPDLLTPVNEFREEHYRRIEFANRELGRDSAVPGWMTERGKMYIILGKPHDRETFLAAPGLYPIDLWFYQANKEKGLPPLYLLFFQEHFAGPYRLFNYLLDDPADLMPAQPLDPANARMGAYEFLQEINPALAHAAITMRADQAPFVGIAQPETSSLDFQTLMSDIEISPFRRLDTRWVDAASEARGLVESDYLFNYVPSVGMLNVIPGPGGESFLHYSVEIEPNHLTLARQEGGTTYYTTFEARGELSTEDGKTIYQSSKELPLQLSETQFRDVMSRPFAYRAMFPVAEGEYEFRLVLKNRARSEYTIFESPVHVPPSSGDAPFLGEPVLLYGSTELSDPDSARLYRTYQLGSLVLDPNAKRVYAIGEPVVVYLPAAHLGTDDQIFLSVVNRETGEPLGSTKTVAAPEVKAPLVEMLDLQGAAGGRYALVAGLLDGTGERVVERTTPFDVSPRAVVSRPWVLRDSLDGENRPVVQTALAEQYLVKGDKERARELCQRAVAEDPNLVAARIILGRLSLDDGNPTAAIRLLEPAHAQHPDNYEVTLALGDAHFQVRHYARAVELFEAALEWQRPGPSLLNALGTAHAQLGNRERAIEYFRRSLELDPTQAGVQSALEKLLSPLPH